jgi:acyl carrier protein
MDNFHKVKEIILTIFENNELVINNEILLSTSLKDDLEMDSIMMAELSVRLEDEFGMDVFEHGLLYSMEEILLKISESKT